MTTIAAFLSMCAVWFPTVEPAGIGRKVARFALHDYRGALQTLDDWRDHKIIVIAYLGNECPLARLYAPKLVGLAKDYEPKGVAFVGVNANVQDSLTEIAHFVKSAGIEFPILKDVNCDLADQLGATRTPEIFVVDADRVVRYRGRVDDQYGVGYQRPRPNRMDLAEALNELLTGKAVSVGTTEVEGCLIGRAHRAAAHGSETYCKDVAPILYRRCLECHRVGEIGPFAMSSYAEVAGWADMMAEVVQSRRMPPWHANPKHGAFANDARLSEAEIQTIVNWARNGAPEGKNDDLPKPPTFVEGWRIGKPDLVLSIPKPFQVPADGTVRYQYFRVDPGFTEDKWVRFAECRPGNRAVVHHMLVLVQPPLGDRLGQRNDIVRGWLAAYAPGARPLILDDGMAKKIPKGAKLIFQMHYTPNGTPQSDQGKLGLIFADPNSIRCQVATRGAANRRIDVPPHANDYRLEASHRFAQDGLLLAMFPHMHLRGKSFRFEAIKPDGQREILLDVPRYDFGWQNAYVLAEPKLMPKGTVIHCQASYDNSAANKSNPDPSARVRWGDQTWEEMMIGYFDVAMVGTSSETPATPEPTEPDASPQP